MDNIFKFGNYEFTVGKITLQQSVDFMRYVDDFLLKSDFTGKGLAENIAQSMEKLPGLMKIIFRGQAGVDDVQWLDIDIEQLIIIREAFEKKNPTTTALFSSSLQNSAFRPLGQLTEYLKNIGMTFSSTMPETEAHAKPTS